MALNDFFIPYHPSIYKKRPNPKHYDDPQSQSLLNLKKGQQATEASTGIRTWIGGILNGVTAPVVIAIAPGHLQGSTGAGNLLHNIFGEFIANDNIIDGRTLLVRTRTVPKSAGGGLEARDQARHEGTIAVSNPDLMRGKVFIFDDFYTTGATLRACKEVAIAAGATSVKLFAVGKTVYYN